MKMPIPGNQARSVIYGVVLAFASSFATAACEKPDFTQQIPDGASATQEQMAAIQAVVGKFVSEGEAYISCVEAEDGKLAADRIRDEMLDRMQKVAADFNRQLRYYKRTNS